MRQQSLGGLGSQSNRVGRGLGPFGLVDVEVGKRPRGREATDYEAVGGTSIGLLCERTGTLEPSSKPTGVFWLQPMRRDK